MLDDDPDCFEAMLRYVSFAGTYTFYAYLLTACII